MKFPKLKIGELSPKLPIIQGGMALKVSTAKLASAVANEGGIGVIAGTAMTPEELLREIVQAKAMSRGIIGVNLMYAASRFMELLKAAITAGIDLIISGAGFSRDMFAVGKETGVPVVPIVSSVKLAKISERLGAAAIVVEGGNAGGHLGTEQDSWDIITKIKAKVSIPVIGAGDAVTPADVKRMFEMGMDGVQMGTRFLASHESNVADLFKELCVKTNDEDVIRIITSTDFPANAIRTRMSELALCDKAPKPTACSGCLKHCNGKFCIKDALNLAREGDIERGIFFTGKGIGKIKEILSVKKIFQQLKDY